MGANQLRTDIPICRWPADQRGKNWEGNLRHATVDNIVLNESRTHVLLVWRAKAEIEGGSWALVGGYVDPGDTIVQTVHNETWQEAAKRVGSLALFRIVDNPNRRNEPAENISHVFVSTVPDPEIYGEIEVADPDGGVQSARWFSLDALPTEKEMAFDHRRILAEYQTDPTTYPLSIFMSGEQPVAA